jgi:hypothetical protein
MAVGPVRTSILVPTFTSAHVFALSPVHAPADALLAHLRPLSNVPDASVTVFEMYALLAMSFEPTSKHVKTLRTPGCLAWRATLPHTLVCVAH